VNRRASPSVFSGRVLVQGRRIQRDPRQGWPCGRAPSQVLGLLSTACQQIKPCPCLPCWQYGTGLD